MEMQRSKRKNQNGKSKSKMIDAMGQVKFSRETHLSSGATARQAMKRSAGLALV
jgi:hypothetical protein